MPASQTTTSSRQPPQLALLLRHDSSAWAGTPPGQVPLVSRLAAEPARVFETQRSALRCERLVQPTSAVLLGPASNRVYRLTRPRLESANCPTFPPPPKPREQSWSRRKRQPPPLHVRPQDSRQLCRRSTVSEALPSVPASMDEMEDEDGGFLGEVVEFGDGTQYKIPTSNDGSRGNEDDGPPVTKDDRFKDVSHDRSWPQRNQARSNVSAPMDRARPASGQPPAWGPLKNREMAVNAPSELAQQTTTRPSRSEQRAEKVIIPTPELLSRCGRPSKAEMYRHSRTAANVGLDLADRPMEADKIRVVRRQLCRPPRHRQSELGVLLRNDRLLSTPGRRRRQLLRPKLHRLPSRVLHRRLLRHRQSKSGRDPLPLCLLRNNSSSSRISLGRACTRSSACSYRQHPWAPSASSSSRLRRRREPSYWADERPLPPHLAQNLRPTAPAQSADSVGRARPRTHTRRSSVRVILLRPWLRRLLPTNLSPSRPRTSLFKEERPGDPRLWPKHEVSRRRRHLPPRAVLPHSGCGGATFSSTRGGRPCFHRARPKATRGGGASAIG